MKIFKYSLKRDTGIQSVQMPRSAKPISFGRDPAGDLCVWATIEAEEPRVEHRFFLAFTGTEFPAARGSAFYADVEGVTMQMPVYRFMGTIQLNGDLARLVIHCFYLDYFRHDYASGSLAGTVFDT